VTVPDLVYVAGYDNEILIDLVENLWLLLLFFNAKELFAELRAKEEFIESLTKGQLRLKRWRWLCLL
jgi:hypothetical protein